MLLYSLYLFTGSALAQDSNLTVEQVEEQARPVTLRQAIGMALANNIEIKQSLLDLETADQQVRLAWSEVLPEITGDANYTRNFELPVVLVPEDFSDSDSPRVPRTTGADNTWNGGFTVDQTIFRGEAIVGIGSSKIFKAAQAENMRATSQQIVTQTRLAYYNVLVAREQRRLQQSAVDRIRQNLQENRSRLKAGLVDEYQVLQLEVQLANEEPLLTEAQYAVEQAYRNLKMVMGVPLELQFAVQGDLSCFDIVQEKATKPINQHLKEIDRLTPYNYERQARMMEVATEMRGDIRALDKQEELKQKEIRAIQSRFLPTLSATYNLNWQPTSPSFFGTNDQRVIFRTQAFMINLSFPLFQGFQRSANLQIARIEGKDLELQMRNTIREAKNEILSTRETLNQSIETAKARVQAIRQAREGYERARVRQENGIGSQIDVTEAEFQLRQAEANYAQMVYDYLSAKARYDQAIGMVPYVDKSKPELE